MIGPDPSAARTALADLSLRYVRPEAARWAPVPPELDRALAEDHALAEVARRARAHLPSACRERLGPLLSPATAAAFSEAVVLVPRERFVLPEDIFRSTDDMPLPLDASNMATVSAPHAYLLSFDLLELAQGDWLVELGTGTGYGAALARELVGSSGRVISMEFDVVLAARARHVRRLLAEADDPEVELFAGDARHLAPAVLRAISAGPSASRPIKVVVTYALRESPEWLLRELPVGSWLVAPVHAGKEGQELVRWHKRADGVRRSEHGGVRYVPERH